MYLLILLFSLVKNPFLSCDLTHAHKLKMESYKTNNESILTILILRKLKKKLLIEVKKVESSVCLMKLGSGAFSILILVSSFSISLD